MMRITYYYLYNLEIPTIILLVLIVGMDMKWIQIVYFLRITFILPLIVLLEMFLMMIFVDISIIVIEWFVILLGLVWYPSNMKKDFVSDELIVIKNYVMN